MWLPWRDAKHKLHSPAALSANICYAPRVCTEQTKLLVARLHNKSHYECTDLAIVGGQRTFGFTTSVLNPPTTHLPHPFTFWWGCMSEIFCDGHWLCWWKWEMKEEMYVTVQKLHALWLQSLLGEALHCRCSTGLIFPQGQIKSTTCGKTTMATNNNLKQTPHVWPINKSPSPQNPPHPHNPPPTHTHKNNNPPPYDK